VKLNEGVADISRHAQLISLVVARADELGLPNTKPVVLNQGGNLILHLTPYPVVARLATVMSKVDEQAAFLSASRELHVAEHLRDRGVATVQPTALADAGPHCVGGAWVTLWEYVPPTELPEPTPSAALAMVTALSEALADHPGDLPALGVWERTRLSAARLQNHSDRRVQALLEEFVEIDRNLRLGQPLLPCHGDAHRRNLMASPRGWLWTDFEDVCLMPAGWDMASYVSNLALFQGFAHRTVSHFLEGSTSLTPDTLKLALTARLLTSVLGNLDFALAGNGDLEFAARQLALAEGYLEQIAQL